MLLETVRRQLLSAKRAADQSTRAIVDLVVGDAIGAVRKTAFIRACRRGPARIKALQLLGTRRDARLSRRERLLRWFVAMPSRPLTSGEPTIVAHLQFQSLASALARDRLSGARLLCQRERGAP